MFNDQNTTLIKNAIENGNYSLLLGAGVSLDSKYIHPLSNNKENMPSGNELKSILKAVINTNEDYYLHDLYSLLSPSQVNKYIRKPFKDCEAGESIKQIPQFVWKKIFTLNIDNALENAYTINSTMQSPKTITYDELYSENQDKTIIPIVHLHGYAQNMDTDLIFSLEQYINLIEKSNRWMFYLGDSLASDPFIIIGSSLQEHDLKYFLTNKSEKSSQPNSPPSILVEPNPNELTKLFCKKHNLTLFKMTCIQFFEFIKSLEPIILSSTELLSRKVGNDFKGKLSPESMIYFSRNFSSIKVEIKNTKSMESLDFLKGAEPNWNDIIVSRDVGREIHVELSNCIRRGLEGKSSDRFLVLLAEIGEGKTTLLRRIGYDFSQLGIYCIIANPRDLTDIQETAEAINSFEGPLLILSDNFLDNAHALISLNKLVTKNDIVFFVAERDYREKYISYILSSTKHQLIYDKYNVTQKEAYRLFSTFEKIGSISSKVNYNKKDVFINTLIGKPIYEACCSISGNQLYLENNISVILRDAKKNNDSVSFSRFLICAMIERFYRGGIGYKLLTKFCGYKGVEDQINESHPLRLKSYGGNDVYDYIVTHNHTLANYVVEYTKGENPEIVLDSLVKFSKILAFYVNRKTIISRTSEVKIAQELFTYRNLKYLIGNKQCELFYKNIRHQWEWNSRYWEQLALLCLEKAVQSVSYADIKPNIELSLQYANTAVSKENHPFTLTTLGKVQFSYCYFSDKHESSLFNDAINNLTLAQKLESEKFMNITRRPIETLLKGINKLSDRSYQLNEEQRYVILNRIDEIPEELRFDKELDGLITQIRSRILLPV